MYAMSELQALAYKAAVGAGLPVGVAQDIAAAGVWLAQRRFTACQIIARGLADVGTKRGDCRTSDLGVELVDVRAAATGTSAVDLLVASGRSTFEVSLKGLDEPALLLGLVGTAADRYAIAIELVVSGRTFVVDPTCSVEPATFPTRGPADIALRRATPSAITSPPCLATRYDPAAVSDTGWDQLERLAKRTYVPATDHSRARGAGAGLTDND
jgi:Protein of unknown function (DUF3726)